MFPMFPTLFDPLRREVMRWLGGYIVMHGGEVATLRKGDLDLTLVSAEKVGQWWHMGAPNPKARCYVRQIQGHIVQQSMS